jgi:Asp-tRNA(Asn)/Glu-tRNA(Gln) amidotransferase C subunit
MLATLSSQLHFVRQIQEVDTAGIEPLRSLRDETVEGESEAELGLDALREALGKEEVRGKFHKRIRRRAGEDQSGEKWDVLGSATKKVGRYFVVEGGKDR